MTSSTPHSSPHIRRQKNMDQTTTTLPQTSSKANQSGKWSKSWGPDASDDPDGSNTESGGWDTPMPMTPGKLRMTSMPRSLLRNSGKETKRWQRKRNQLPLHITHDDPWIRPHQSTSHSPSPKQSRK